MLAEALEVPEVGRNDDFFSLGGDSILAVQLAARARDAGIPLTARMVFEHPAIHELAATVDNAGASARRSADTHHEPMAASGLSADELAAVTALFSSTGSPRKTVSRDRDRSEGGRRGRDGAQPAAAGAVLTVEAEQRTR